MAISRYAAATDAIVALARADTTLTTAAVEIVDGPPIQQQYGTTVLYVGWTGDEESDAAGTIQSAYHDLGPAAKRDETCEIRCITRAVRGDDNMSQARADAVAAFGALETALRANVSLGLAEILRFEVSDAAVNQARDSLGLACELDFTITVISLI